MSKHVIQCWSCGTRLTLDERSENDGECPECDSELALDDYLDQAVTENEQLRAELAALKAWQGEAVAVAEVVWPSSGIRHGAFRSLDGSGLEVGSKLYTAPPATGVIVDPGLLRRVLSFMDSTNKNYPMPYEMREELRALLARQEVKS